MTTQPPPVGGAVLEPLPAEHERGVPSVNAPRAVTRWTRVLLTGGLLIGVPVARSISSSGLNFRPCR